MEASFKVPFQPIIFDKQASNCWFVETNWHKDDDKEKQW